MLVQRWTSKPWPGVGLDWTHPLTRGLVGCWIFNEKSGLTVHNYGLSGYANNGVFSTTGSNLPTWSGSPSGGGILVAEESPTIGPYVECGNIYGFASATNASLFAIGRLAATPHYWIFGVGTDATNRIQIELWSDGIFYVVVNSDYPYCSNPTGDFSVGATFDGSQVAASRAQGYINGVRQALTGTVSSTALGSSTAQINLSHYIDAYSDGRFDAAMMWAGRTLTAQDMQDLHADPWQIFQPNVSYFLFTSVVELDTGSGSISAAATIEATGLATYTGSGGISAAATIAATGLVTAATGIAGVTSSGTIAATGLATYTGSGGISATGTIAATGLVTDAVGEAGVTSSGTIAATGLATYAGSGEVDSTGTIAATGLVTDAVGEAGITSSGTIEATGLATYAGSGEIDATATIEATGLVTDAVGESGVTSSGTIEATGLATYAGSGEAIASGTISATGLITDAVGEAGITSSGTIAATGLATYAASGEVDASTTIEAIGTALEPGTGAAEITAASTIEATGLVTDAVGESGVSSASTIEATGLVTDAIGEAGVTSSGTIEATGLITYTPAVEISPAGFFECILPDTGLTLTQWVSDITTINCTIARTAAINCSNTNSFLVNLYSGGGTHTFTLTNLRAGQTVEITIVQGSTFGTVAWGGNGNQTIVWTNGITPTLSTTANYADRIVLYSPIYSVIVGTLDFHDFYAGTGQIAPATGSGGISATATISATGLITAASGVAGVSATATIAAIGEASGVLAGSAGITASGTIAAIGKVTAASGVAGITASSTISATGGVTAASGVAGITASSTISAIGNVTTTSGVAQITASTRILALGISSDNAISIQIYPDPFLAALSTTSTPFSAALLTTSTPFSSALSTTSTPFDATSSIGLATNFIQSHTGSARITASGIIAAIGSVYEVPYYTGSAVITATGAIAATGSMYGWYHLQGSGVTSFNTQQLQATFPVAVTEGSLIVVGLGNDTNGGTFTVSDNINNIPYSEAVSGGGSLTSGTATILWYVVPQGGGGYPFTVTFDSQYGTYPVMSIDEYRPPAGVVPSLESSGNAEGDSVAATIASPLSITHMDLIVATCKAWGASGLTITPEAGFQTRYDIPWSSSPPVNGLTTIDELNVDADASPFFALDPAASWVIATAAFTPVSILSYTGSGGITASGGISATGLVTYVSSGGITATGGISATGLVTYTGSAVITATGGISATGSMYGWYHLQGSGATTFNTQQLQATFPVAVTEGSLIVVGLGNDTNGGTFTVSDNINNTPYATAVSGGGSLTSGTAVILWYIVPQGGGGYPFTVTFDSQYGAYPVMSINEYRPPAGCVPSVEMFGAAEGNGAVAAVSTPVSITHTDLLVATCKAWGAEGQIITPAAGFQTRYDMPWSTNPPINGLTTIDELNVNVSTTPSFSLGPASQWVMATAAFTPVPMPSYSESAGITAIASIAATGTSTFMLLGLI